MLFRSRWGPGLRGEVPGGPKGRIGSTDESRRRGAEASQIREVVLLDFPWERELPLTGRWREQSIHPSPEEGRRELAPARSPRMPGQQGSPGWEGQKGRPEESDRPKLSRKIEEGQKEEGVRRQKTEPIDAEAIPGVKSRSLQSHYRRLGTGGGDAPGPFPSSLRDP